ncbi:MAG: hypothetical protein J2P17_22710, partial [Mycobacterium sp.]|nr:hypothetical protein [Mycobacterium sp.]
MSAIGTLAALPQATELNASDQPHDGPGVGVRAAGGEVIVIRGLLDAIGMTEACAAASLGAIEEV